MPGTEFDLDGGALCLDFVNTLEWRESERPVDHLATYDDLVAWGLAAGTLTATMAARLRERARRRPKEATAALAGAVALREAIHDIFHSLIHKQEAPPAGMARLNEALQEALSRRRLAAGPGAYAWQWPAGSDVLEQMVWPVAVSAAELLTGDELDRISVCADDRGCGYLFLDRSRNRSRRWCSMETCGNRAKARRHYQKVREDHA